MAKIYIGTSGWQYPHWISKFYPPNLSQKDWLLYYAKYFDTLEVNATFYRQMKPETFAKWREVVGSDFVFAIKGSRFITHIKRLKDCQEEVERFFEAANSLTRCHLVRGDTSRDSREKKILRLPAARGNTSRDVILWQFPPGMKADIERFKSFLRILPQDWRHAFEFRHQSWVDLQVFTTVLHRTVEWTVVFQDWPDWPRITEDKKIYQKYKNLLEKFPFIYVRFHGKRILYASCYSEEELDLWAKKMKQWTKEGLDVYAYFNNDAMGYAIENARRLKELL